MCPDLTGCSIDAVELVVMNTVVTGGNRTANERYLERADLHMGKKLQFRGCQFVTCPLPFSRGETATPETWHPSPEDLMNFQKPVWACWEVGGFWGSQSSWEGKSIFIILLLEISPGSHSEGMQNKTLLFPDIPDKRRGSLINICVVFLTCNFVYDRSPLNVYGIKTNRKLVSISQLIDYKYILFTFWKWLNMMMDILKVPRCWLKVQLENCTFNLFSTHKLFVSYHSFCLCPAISNCIFIFYLFPWRYLYLLHGASSEDWYYLMVRSFFYVFL